MVLGESTFVEIPFGDLAIVEHITAPSPPRVLHHYTRRAGLLGILKSRQLHASNAKYLNDAKELSVALTEAARFVEEKQTVTTGEEARLWKAVAHFLESLESRWDVFVFSFSEDSDQLSQWRAYTKPGDGYSIGFNAEEIARLPDHTVFHLAKCYYTAEEHAELLNLVISDGLNMLERELEPANANANQAHVRALTAFASSFFVAAPILKHPTFAEEREWRLIRPVGSVWEDGVRFRDGHGLLIPYYAVDFGEQPLPIAEVRVGPTPHADLEKRALSGLLTSAGKPEVSVVESEIPFRNW